jgi:hypothetical protein
MSRFYNDVAILQLLPVDILKRAAHGALMNATIIGLGEPETPLLSAVGAELGLQGINFRVVTTAQLPDLKASICGSRFFVDGVPVAGVLTHDLAGLDLSCSDPLDDQAFFNAELRAIWLAGMNLASVLAINRYPSSAWYDQHSFVRGLMREADIPVASFQFGGDAAWQRESDWLPDTEDQRLGAFDTGMHSYLGSALALEQPVANGLWICGELISGSATRYARDAARCLDSVGMRIVEISTDEEGKVSSVDPQPNIWDPYLLERAAALVSNCFRAHLHHWRAF